MKLAIIDGTGPFNDGAYAHEMRHSFCKQMSLQMKSDAHYERGPSDDGYFTKERGDRAAQFLLKAKRASPNTPLMLAGYSRGGSAAVMAAEVLQRERIDVDGLFLFDPVARHPSKGGVVIPANVKQVWTARRSLDPGLVAKYDHTIGPLWHTIAHNPMRVFFGSTDNAYLGNAHNSHTQLFRGSHGALGGVGWTHVTEDPHCQKLVAGWMNLAFRQVRLPIQLHAFPPSCTP